MASADLASEATAAPGAVDGFRPVKSADRTLDILETLAGRPGPRPSLGDLSKLLGIPKSSLHGILRTMQQRGWVETDETGLRFGLGVRALLVGASYVDTDPAVAGAQAALDWASAQTGETVHLGRLEGTDVVYLAKRESQHPLRMFSAIGRRLPAHATALGKALLAARADEAVAELVGRTPARLTDRTLTRRSELLADLAATRRRGYAVDNEENTEGMRCVAATIPVAGGVPQDALSISVPVVRLTSRRLRELGGIVREAAERAGRQR